MRSAYRVLADVKSEKLKSHLAFMGMKGMGEVGLARFQFQSHACQPCLGDVLGLLNDSLMRMEHHEIIRVAHDGRLPAFSFVERREGRGDRLLSSVKGDIG